jgi:hypothetical protein
MGGALNISHYIQPAKSNFKIALAKKWNFSPFSCVLLYNEALQNA